MKPFLLALACGLFCTLWGAEPVLVEVPYFGIRVVDEVTGEGVPLVELRMVNGIRQFTDNAGWVAFREPGLMDREVHWHVSGPGIERAQDGFGNSGFRAEGKPGTSTTVTVKNTKLPHAWDDLPVRGCFGILRCSGWSIRP